MNFQTCSNRLRLAVTKFGFGSVLLFVTSFIGPASAGPSSPLAAPDRSSPHDWAMSFLAEGDRFESLYSAYLTDQTRANVTAMFSQMDVLLGFFDLSSFPDAFRQEIGGEAATVLFDIISRLPPDSLLSGPADPTGTETLPDHWTIPGTEISLVRKDVGLEANIYVVPAEVIKSLPRFHDRIINFPLTRDVAFRNLRSEQVQTTGPLIPFGLVNLLPGVVKAPILGTPIWKQATAVALFFVLLWLNLAWARLTKRILPSVSEGLVAIFRLSGSALLAASFAAFHFFLTYELNIQGAIAILSVALRDLSVIAAGAWLVWSLTMIAAEFAIGSEVLPEQQLDAHLTRLVGKIIATVGAGATVIYGLSSIGIPAAGLITSLGVGGVGVALAARVTLENLIGGLVLLIDRPFRVGDSITFSGGAGRVLDVGPRSCRIQSADGQMIVIPNSVLASQPITNLGALPSFPLSQLINLPPGLRGAEVKERLETARRLIAGMPGVRAADPDHGVRLALSGDNEPQIQVEVAVNARSAAEFETTRTGVLLQMLEIASGTNASLPRVSLAATGTSGQAGATAS